MTKALFMLADGATELAGTAFMFWFMEQFFSDVSPFIHVSGTVALLATVVAVILGLLAAVSEVVANAIAGRGIAPAASLEFQPAPAPTPTPAADLDAGVHDIEIQIAKEKPHG